MNKLLEIAEKRHKATNEIEQAILVGICNATGCTKGEAYETYSDWIDDEDGEVALTRLVNLVIY